MTQKGLKPGSLSRENEMGGATRRGTFIHLQRSLIINHLHWARCRHVKEGILSRATMRMLWVAVLVFCRRFSCQARSTFLQVMTFQFAKNHLSGLRGGWRNSMVSRQSSAGRSQECGAVITVITPLFSALMKAGNNLTAQARAEDWGL